MTGGLRIASSNFFQKYHWSIKRKGRENKKKLSPDPPPDITELLTVQNFLLTSTIGHFRKEKGTGAKIRPAIVSRIVIRDALVRGKRRSNSNSPRSLCEN